jgi:hypothetical protein
MLLARARTATLLPMPTTAAAATMAAAFAFTMFPETAVFTVLAATTATARMMAMLRLVTLPVTSIALMRTRLVLPGLAAPAVARGRFGASGSRRRFGRTRVRIGPVSRAIGGRRFAGRRSRLA